MEIISESRDVFMSILRRNLILKKYISFILKNKILNMGIQKYLKIDFINDSCDNNSFEHEK